VVYSFVCLKEIKITFTMVMHISLSDAILIEAFVQFFVDILPKDSIVWKLKMLRTESSYVNSRLHAVKV
jgi:hypothetical protein